MTSSRTLSRGRPTTPAHHILTSAAKESHLPTPSSVEWDLPKPEPQTPEIHSQTLRTQKEVEAYPTIKRLQQDLLILTSFNDNSSLSWQPSWFKRRPLPESLWTIHNPPNVVTAPLPNAHGGIQLYTRRMRRLDDTAPIYIRDWAQWARYCDLYGVPRDFLCEEQIRLLRLGLPRSANGDVCTPPWYPLYPEPALQGRYALPASSCAAYLPRKFQHVVSQDLSVTGESSVSAKDYQGSSEIVVVAPDGTLSVVARGDWPLDLRASKGCRWSYVPWTKEMEDSCRPLTLKVRFWNEGREQKT